MLSLDNCLESPFCFIQSQIVHFSDAVKTLVGEENARRGTIKMFEVLQDVRLNKHLFYVSANNVCLLILNGFFLS